MKLQSESKIETEQVNVPKIRSDEEIQSSKRHRKCIQLLHNESYNLNGKLSSAAT